jgi:hypothetical protein
MRRELLRRPENLLFRPESLAFIGAFSQLDNCLPFFILTVEMSVSQRGWILYNFLLLRLHLRLILRLRLCLYLCLRSHLYLRLSPRNPFVSGFGTRLKRVGSRSYRGGLSNKGSFLIKRLNRDLRRELYIFKEEFYITRFINIPFLRIVGLIV